MLLNPNKLVRRYPDARSAEIMAATVEFFESRGKARLKKDDHDRAWYSDFLNFIAKERIFASLLTPAEYGASDEARWDTYRLSEFAEIIGFYGLSYWYPFQVTALGLGPIWMSDNEDAKRKAAAQLEQGEVFAFGLSEQTHGADVYQTDMILTPSEHGWTASGEKYYIGNANVARMVSTFGKIDGSDEYVFFAADSHHDRYELKKNVVNSQNYVANYALHEYPVTEADLLHRGLGAFHAALNTVNVCKYNLGWGAVGMCTHAIYEAVTHAANRHLYGTVVTDFSHVRRLLTDAYVRLVAMRLVCTRASDYMRSASAEDRRYLLYSPLTKAKVTSEGERVITGLWDVIAAKGVEKDTFFETVSREIGLLPRLEGTVHINIGLLAKFMPNFLFAPDASLPSIPRRDDAADDTFLFDQGPTGGLGKVRFHDWRPSFDKYAHLGNVALLRDQIDVLAEMLASATPSAAQQKDIDFAFGVGQLFATVPYAQLILEEARFAMRMVRRPAFDASRYDQIWKEYVLPLNGAYEMRP
jgi:acyl-CoA dehydrogenase